MVRDEAWLVVTPTAGSYGEGRKNNSDEWLVVSLSRSMAGFGWSFIILSMTEHEENNMLVYVGK